MEFYELILDKDYCNGPKMKNWFGKLKPDEVCYGFAHNSPKHQLFYVEKNKDLLFPDVVLSPVLLVSDEGIHVIRMYRKYIPYHQVVLMAEGGNPMRVYHMPFIEKLVCTKTVQNQGTEEYFLEETEKMLQRMPIFQFEYKMEKHYVVRLDLLESLLRRNQNGFTVKPIRVKGK